MNLHTHRLREPRLQRGAIPFRSSYRLVKLAETIRFELTPEEFQALLGELKQRERLLVGWNDRQPARRTHPIALGGHRLREERGQRYSRNLA